MKLEEAATILGVPADTDLEILKQKYKKIAMGWQLDKCADPKTREKIQQISIAYTKLVSNKTGEEFEDDESDDDNPTGDDDANEMREFMRMFMDFVGMFNEEKNTITDKKMAGMAQVQPVVRKEMDDWSTEEEEDQDEDDDDDDDYDSEGDDGDGEISWEPMAKNYIHMNLKEEASKERRKNRGMDPTDRDVDDPDSKKKLKNAKKRAEKRRKQKEKKMREAAQKAEEDDRLRRQEEELRIQEEEKLLKLKEEQRAAQERENTRRFELFQAVAAGDSERMKKILWATDTNLKVTDRLDWDGHLGLSLLHCCVSDMVGADGSPLTNDPHGAKLAAARREVAMYLCNLRNPAVDLNAADEDGKTVLHYTARCGDAELLDLVIRERNEVSDKRAGSELLINTKCSKLGWTPLHYAADQGCTQVIRVLINAGALLNVHASIGSAKDGQEKGPTPLQLVQNKLKSKAILGGRAAAYKASEAELSSAIDKIEKSRQQREQEKLQKLHRSKDDRSNKQSSKEKQDVQKQRENEEDVKKKATAGSSSATSVPPPAATITSKPVTTNASNAPPSIQPTTPTATAAAVSSSVGAKGAKDKKKEKKGKEKKKENEEPESSGKSSVMPVVSDINIGLSLTQSVSTPLVTPSSTNSSGAAIVADIASRDEVVDYLLAMGFSEANCLAALTACGTDFDRCISWLCERPSAESDVKKSSTTSASKPAGSGGGGGGMGKEKADATTAAQREKDHKEELRRINREWNAKVPQQRAEEEKKKAEAEAEKKKIASLQAQLQRQQLQSSVTAASINQSYSGSSGTSNNVTQRPVQIPSTAFSSSAIPVNILPPPPGMVYSMNNNVGVVGGPFGTGLQSIPTVPTPLANVPMQNMSLSQFAGTPQQHMFNTVDPGSFGTNITGNFARAKENMMTPQLGKIHYPTALCDPQFDNSMNHQTIPIMRAQSAAMPVNNRPRGPPNMSMDLNKYGSAPSSLQPQPQSYDAHTTHPQPTDSNYSYQMLNWAQAGSDYYSLSSDPNMLLEQQPISPSNLEQRQLKNDLDYLNFSLDGAIELSPGAKPFIPQFNNTNMNSGVNVQTNSLMDNILANSISRTNQTPPPGDWSNQNIANPGMLGHPGVSIQEVWGSNTPTHGMFSTGLESTVPIGRDDLNVELDLLKALGMDSNQGLVDDNRYDLMSDHKDSLGLATSSLGLSTGGFFSTYTSPSISTLLGGIGRRYQSENIYGVNESFGIGDVHHTFSASVPSPNNNENDPIYTGHFGSQNHSDRNVSDNNM